MTLGLFLLTVAVAFIWSGVRNKDLREAIPLFFTGKNPDNASPISQPLPSDEPISGSGSNGQVSGATLGKVTDWNKQTVFAYGLILCKAFGVRIISHCRPGARTRSGNPSLHAQCLALDLKGTQAEETRLARWAVATGVFAEVIYTHATTPGYDDATIADHDGRSGTRHVHIGFKKRSRVPIPPGFEPPPLSSVAGGTRAGGIF